MRPRASIRLFHIGGVPVYAHLTLPIGFALVSQLEIRPWAWLGLLIIVLVHEFGHVVLLHRYRIPVIHVVLHGFGGECQAAEWITPWQRSVVAWGGVLGQAALFAVVALAAELHVVPKAVVSTDLYSALMGTNLLVAVFNLLPLSPLDGSQAWRIVRFGYLRAKQSWLAHRLARLRAIEASSDAAERDRRLH